MRDNIIRLKPLAGPTNLRSTSPSTKTDEPSEAPPAIRRGRAVLRPARTKLFAKFPKALVVDVRSPVEFANRSLHGAINVPFELTSQTEREFRWDVTNQEVADARFDFQKIEDAADGQAVVIVGGPPSDGRAFWAVHFLSRLSFSNLFFLHEGI